MWRSIAIFSASATTGCGSEVAHLQAKAPVPWPKPERPIACGSSPQDAWGPGPRSCGLSKAAVAGSSGSLDPERRKIANLDRGQGPVDNLFAQSRYGSIRRRDAGTIRTMLMQLPANAPFTDFHEGGENTFETMVPCPYQQLERGGNGHCVSRFFSQRPPGPAVASWQSLDARCNFKSQSGRPVMGCRPKYN